VRPQAGSTWAHKGRPVRHPATYKRPHGVRYYFGAFDVHANRLWMKPKKRKRWQEALSFLRWLRKQYPDGRRIYLVLDNLSTHKKDDVVDWCGDHNIRLVFTATNASWMNRIECHFTPVKRFVISNSNYPDHGAIARAMRKYVRWRNRNPNHKKLKKLEKTRRIL